MQFAVFSFNRGAFLAHCLKSLERCAPGAQVTIYDDASSDAETVKVLQGASARHRVVNCRAENLHGGRGGLHANMQRALEEAESDQPLAMVQDDMQLVRPLDAQDLESVQRIFSADPQTRFVHPCFLKGSNREKDQRRTFWHAPSQSYRRLPEKRGAGVYYSDVCIVLPQRLLADRWNFAQRESGNEAMARERYPQMNLLRDPFLMWLPAVPVYRGRRKTWSLQQAEKQLQAGLHPFRMLDTQAIQSLRQRPQEQLPVAEDWLELEQDVLPRPWRYDPFQGSNLLRNLDRLERKFAR